MIYVDEETKLVIDIDQIRAIGRASLEDDTVITVGFKNLGDDNLLQLVGEQSDRFWNWFIEKWRAGTIS
jgi:hypothetical protein